MGTRSQEELAAASVAAASQWWLGVKLGVTCACCGHDETSPECICTGWINYTGKCERHRPHVTVSAPLFEVIDIEGAIEKQGHRELISHEEMEVLNYEFLVFLEERGYGFGGVMRGLEGLRTLEPADEQAPPPPPQDKDPGVRVSEGGRPVLMPTTAVHPLEPYSRPQPRWLGVVVCAVFVLAVVVPGILLLVL